jgi:hypothetical protein
MKKILVITAFFMTGMFCMPSFGQVTIRFNFVVQPDWGPEGYDYVEYYYFPDIEAYYHVPRREYIYLVNGNWVTKAYLPSHHRNFDLYKARKIVINDARPYAHHKEHKSRYASMDGHSSQRAIRDSRDARYFENKRHPEHARWKKEQKENRQKKGRVPNNNSQQNVEKSGKKRN